MLAFHMVLKQCAKPPKKPFKASQITHGKLHSRRFVKKIYQILIKNKKIKNKLFLKTNLKFQKIYYFKH